MACRDTERGMAAAESLREKGLDVEFRELDVSNQESVQSFSELLNQDYSKIDLLVNNAAVYLESMAIPLSKKAKTTIEINYFGTVWVTQAVLPLLRNSATPRIVNVSSELGRLSMIKSTDIRDIVTSEDLSVGQLTELISNYLNSALNGKKNSWGCSCYSVSKVGVIAFTKILAKSEPAIIVNACSPGYCSTDMSGGKGDKTPEEGSRTVFMTSLIVDTSCRGKLYADEAEIEW